MHRSDHEAEIRDAALQLDVITLASKDVDQRLALVLNDLNVLTEVDEHNVNAGKLFFRPS